MVRRVPRPGETIESVRRVVVQSTLSLFDHAAYPLADTLDYFGDSGLLGPGSVSWEVLADPAAIVGGLRGLLVQAAHPEVVAGVGDHSRYQQDPFGRLSRTSAYVTATTFGAMPEVEAAVEQVRRYHRIVKGVSHRGIPYDAGDRELSAWVHNALTNSFLVTNQVYGGRRLSDSEADRFVAEQTAVGRLLGSDPLPQTRLALETWVSTHPDLAPSPALSEVIDFLTSPPLSRPIRIGYTAILEAAVATIPGRLRQVLGLRRRPGAEQVGKAVIGGLRWALGYSPSWALALERVGAELPAGLFRQQPGERLAS